MTATTRRAQPRPAVGQLLREWRERRRMSQLDLALEAEISTRHLSFVETGRSRPSSEMILRLCEHLDVPLRERNVMLLAGGYAPAYPEHELAAPELGAVRDAVHRLLAAHEPYPAVAVDAAWHLVDANRAITLFTDGAAPELLTPPVNVLRLGLHPDGMAPRIRNLGEWRGHILERLRRQITATADRGLAALYDELVEYPCAEPDAASGPADVVVPLRYTHRGHELSLLSTTSVFGTPRDVTVAGLAVESFFPADEATATLLRDLAG